MWRRAAAALHDKGKAVACQAINGMIDRQNDSTRQETLVRLNGMFSDPNQREAALDVDLPNQKGLGYKDVITLQDKQAKLRQNLEADPRVNRAVGWMQQGLGAELTALGLIGTGPGQ